jgi:hypothetical protein
MTHDDEQHPIAIPLDQLKQLAMTVAQELAHAAGGTPDQPIAGTGGGSIHRNLPDELREGFINVRAALFQRGIYDPVLVRFDTATVTQASVQELAKQLAAVAETL